MHGEAADATGGVREAGDKREKSQRRRRKYVEALPADGAGLQFELGLRRRLNLTLKIDIDGQHWF